MHGFRPRFSLNQKTPKEELSELIGGILENSMQYDQEKVLETNGAVFVLEPGHAVKASETKAALQKFEQDKLNQQASEEIHAIRCKVVPDSLVEN